MNDKSLTKVICRIITLLQYILVTFGIILETEIFTTDTEIELINLIFSDIKIPIFICAIPLIIMMIISLIFKYTYKDKSKVNPYRIVDVITRIVFTMPTTLIITYIVFKFCAFEIYVNIGLGIVSFIILNLIMRFTLQETMDVSFIINDSL